LNLEWFILDMEPRLLNIIPDIALNQADFKKGHFAGLDEAVVEQDIRNSFYSFGEIRSITVVPKQVPYYYSIKNDIIYR
jgi:hypothetical protein